MTRTLLSASLLLLASAAATAGERPYPEGKAPTIANAERAFPALSAIYMFSGARSNSMDSNTGTQTSVHCFNASNVARQVRFLVRDFAGTVSDDNTISIPRLATRTYSTAATALYFEDITGTLLGTLSQGSIV
ncbi:MAG: hypothetical protein MUC58_11960, partial [Rhizobiaceae bacterium]|nr:hypothetical protein [Rhizobiaceae bacterium]